MNFIKILQQGGFILPQYAPMQSTYTPPNSAMQSLNSMLQSDQQTFNQNVQLQQLNMQDQQLAVQKSNAYNSAKIQSENQTRLNAINDLQIEAHRFKESQEILKQLDAQRKSIKEGFLPKDQISVQNVLKESGLDEEGILNSAQMKGGLSFKNVMPEFLKARSLISAQKNGLTNMQNFTKASEIITHGTKELERGFKLLNDGILEPKAFLDYISALNAVQKDAIDFYNGSINSLDFENDNFSKVAGVGNFLDEVALKNKIQIAQDLEKANTASKLADANLKKVNADIAMAKLPYETAKMFSDMITSNKDMLKTFSILSDAGINIDPSDPAGLLTQFNDLSPAVKDNIINELEKITISKTDAEHAPKTLDQLKAWIALEAFKTGNVDLFNERLKLLQQVEASNGSTGEVDQANGHTYYIKNNYREYSELGYRTSKTNSNDIKQVNVELFSGMYNGIVKSESGKKIVEITNTNGVVTKFDLQVDSNTGEAYLVVKNADQLQKLTGSRGEKNTILGINEIEDYGVDEKGNCRGKAEACIQRLQKLNDDSDMWVIRLSPYNNIEKQLKDLDKTSSSKEYDPTDTETYGNFGN